MPGFVFVETANYHPFAPYGARGVLRGASVVFFAYIGFDAVAVAAEECHTPARWGTRGTLGMTKVRHWCDAPV